MIGKNYNFGKNQINHKQNQQKSIKNKEKHKFYVDFCWDLWYICFVKTANFETL